MEIEFFSAKNGEISARFNSLSLHSAYSPTQEAKRFVDNIHPPFLPSIIFLVEPAVSYITSEIKKKFPAAKIGIIRFSNDFSKYNNNADYIIQYKDGATSIQNELLNQLTEEEICSTYFVSWEPCAKAFSEQNQQTWLGIKAATKQAKTLLITREYFEKKWLLNCCNFVSKVQNSFILQKKIDFPTAIVASGPSLNSKLVFLKENQNKFFIICLSSAISCLLKNGIIPDLCFSTDGGFWAGEHLKKLKNFKIPIALSTEAYCPGTILKNNPIIPLQYEDGFTKSIINKIKYKTVCAYRNGTVSGTALDFALQNCSKEIFFFGLDLATSKEFQHTQPNELEINSSIKDYKLLPAEKRLFSATLNGSSLKIYENWFTQKIITTNKVYRIIEANEKKNTFSHIQDISLNQLKEITDSFVGKDNCFEKYFSKITQNINNNELLNFLETQLDNQSVQKNLFPLDFVVLNHNSTEKEVVISRISEKKDKLLSKIRKLFK